jgi:tetratricopeptide (TPR) repeat protein
VTKWRDWSYLDTLAVAYAETGKFDKAAEWQQKAIELAPEGADKEPLRKRLELYRNGKPYREPAPKAEAKRHDPAVAP